MSENRRFFGKTPKGESVELITIKNDNIKCEIITFGAAIRALYVPNKDKQPTDIVLGYDNIEDYTGRNAFFGAVVGRHANRIANGRFTMNGREYTLNVNREPNHLHGGFVGFSHRVWNVEQLEDSSVTLSLFSPDGEENYPGNLNVKVTYEIDGNSFSIRYRAESDKDTVCNLTNHSYFNLGGHDSGNVLEQKVQLFADSYTPADKTGIPLGSIESVTSTPMDRRELRAISDGITADFEQIKQCGGYDHNFMINGEIGTMRPAAFAESEQSKITMAVYTTLPAMQFYTANYIEEGRPGKCGKSYGKHHGFCMETHFPPDSVNHPDFPQAFLSAGEKFDHKTVFTFSIKE